jgi:flagellar hook-length control protein FliK
MLQLTNLLLPELLQSDKPLNNMNLLPQEAIVPDAAFGELLTASLVELTDPVLPAGDALPLDGNTMPVELAEQAAEAVVAEIVQLPTDPLSVSSPPEPAAGELVAAIPEDLVTTRAAEAVAANPAPMVAKKEALPWTPPPAAAIAAGEISRPTDARARQQTHAIPVALATTAVTQPATVATDAELPMAAAPALLQQAPSKDSGERRDRPADSAERVLQHFAAVRTTADAELTSARAFETSRDEAMQHLRSLQQLAPQAQQTQQPQSVTMPAIAPNGASPTMLAPAPTPPPAGAMVSVNTPVTDPAWGEQIGERVVLIANKQLQNAEIRLSPAELGPLRIQIRVDDGALNITFNATHSVTREAIEQAMPRLREMFVENGLSLGDTNVNEQGIGQQSDTGRDAAGNALAENVEDGELLNASAAESAAELRTRRVIDGLVDTFV